MTQRLAYLSDAHEMLFDAHWRGFEFFDGVVVMIKLVRSYRLPIR